MKSTDLTIRDARIPEEFDKITQLWKSAGPGIHLSASDSLEEIQKKQLHDPDLFLIAEEGGKLIGTVLGGFDGRRGIVYHLAVSENYRRQGVGESLMTELELRFKEKGCIRSYLLVTKENKDSMEFYLKRGWSNLELNVMGKNIE